MIFKILILKFLISLAKKLFKFKSKINFVEAFIIDFACMTPAMTVSAIVNMLDCGMVTFN